MKDFTTTDLNIPLFYQGESFWMMISIQRNRLVLD